MMLIASWKPVKKPQKWVKCLCCGRGQPPGRFRMDVNAKSDEMRFPAKLASCWSCMKFGLVRKGFAAMTEDNPPPEWEKCRAMVAKAMDELGKIWWANQDRKKQMEQAVKLRQGLASEVNKAGLAVWDGFSSVFECEKAGCWIGTAAEDECPDCGSPVNESPADAKAFRKILAKWFVTLRDDWRTQPEEWRERRKAGA